MDPARRVAVRAGRRLPLTRKERQEAIRIREKERREKRQKHKPSQKKELQPPPEQPVG